MCCRMAKSFGISTSSNNCCLKDKDQLARALGRKLLSYGTGGSPAKSDQAEIEAIVAQDSSEGLWIANAGT